QTEAEELKLVRSVFLPRARSARDAAPTTRTGVIRERSAAIVRPRGFLPRWVRLPSDKLLVWTPCFCRSFRRGELPGIRKGTRRRTRRGVPDGNGSPQTALGPDHGGPRRRHGDDYRRRALCATTEPRPNDRTGHRGRRDRRAAAPAAQP